MDEGPEDFDPESPIVPRIVHLGTTDNFLEPSKSSFNDSVPLEYKDEEIEIIPGDWSFIPNQNAEIITHEDGSLEVSVLQHESTPGVRSKIPLVLPPGDYVLTVVGFSDTDSTFFPWAIDQNKIRLTPTAHIPTIEEPTSVHFRVEVESNVYFGVLSHRQEIGDKCYIQSFHISQSNPIKEESGGTFRSIKFHDFIPHQQTSLSSFPDGVEVRSKPISTPGTYALIDVNPDSTITIFVRVSVVFPSVCFLYVADSKSGNELIKRNFVFEPLRESERIVSSELFSSIEIPSGVSQIRLGLLFSTVSQPEEHVMKIHSFEVVEYVKFAQFVDESYVINLRGDEEKFSFCKAQASRFDFGLTRWEATDGNSGKHLKDWEGYMEKPWNEMDEKLGRKAIDRPGAWGYLFSMRGIFTDAIAKDHDSIAIFDDDFILSKSFDHRFSKLVELIGDSWDIIYLGASQWLWDNSTLPETPSYRPDENTNGSFAVIYRKQVFEQIINEIDRMEAPFDAGPLRNVVLGKSRGRSHVAFPNIVIANLEKPGIRESRNQLEFSKRFGWNLEDFPPWFSSWSNYPTVLLSSFEPPEKEGLVFVTAVTTINRLGYLQDFISDWVETKSPDLESILIVADDGSTDGTLEWLTETLELENSSLVVIRNNGSGIARQTNSILDFISNMNYPVDSVFMCNDDIRFLKSGWDLEYYEAMQSSGFEHLVYFNSQWKNPSHEEYSQRSSDLISYCSAREAMGCFYTLTPELINRLGFFDEGAFPVRGHSHVDYTLRACRIEANDNQFLFDLANSNDLIGMVMREGYKRTFRTLSVKEMRLTTSDVELSKRESVLLTEDRVFVPRGW